jgi:hypothetical protein
MQISTPFRSLLIISSIAILTMGSSLGQTDSSASTTAPEAPALDAATMEKLHYMEQQAWNLKNTIQSGALSPSGLEKTKAKLAKIQAQIDALKKKSAPAAATP